MMDQQLFESLLAQGRVSEILMQGGANLTKKQLETVKAYSKQESSDELERRKIEMANKPGYRDFMTMPLVSKVMASAGGGQIPQQNQTAQPQRVQQTEQEQPEQTQQKPKDKKDPQFTSIGPKNTQNLRVNDTEADVIAKLYNFMQRKQQYEKKQHDELEKYHKERKLEKDQRTEDIIAALLGETPRRIGGAKVSSKTNSEIIKEGKKKKGTSLLKMGALGAVAAGGVMIADKAFASIGKIQLPDFGDLGKKPVVKTEAPKESDADWKKDTEFLSKVFSYSKEKKINPEDLLGVMAMESKMDPSIVNPKSGATGLIQFMPKTAEGLGTTTEKLKGMSRSEQFEYVKQYLDKVGLKEGATGADIYAKVFLPARSESDILTRSGESYYEANKGLDIGKKGYIQKSDLESWVEKKKKEYDVASVAPPEIKVAQTKTQVQVQNVTEEYIDKMNSTWQETLDILEKLEQSIGKISVVNVNKIVNNNTNVATKIGTINDTPALMQKQ